MFATFICKHCNDKIIVDFSKPDRVPNSCPKCHSKISNSNYIAAFSDSFLNLQRALYDLKLCSISSGESDFIYESDMKSLNELYMHSSQEIKNILGRILDINLLMVYHAAKDEDIRTLEAYAAKLKEIWTEKVNFEQKEF